MPMYSLVTGADADRTTMTAHDVGVSDRRDWDTYHAERRDCFAG
jgi:hypothetical protein